MVRSELFIVLTERDTVDHHNDEVADLAYVTKKSWIIVSRGCLWTVEDWHSGRSHDVRNEITFDVISQKEAEEIIREKFELG